MKKLKKAKEVNENVLKNIRCKEFVDVLFNKKMIRHNMKRIQGNCTELQPMFVKFHCLVLMIKDIY